MIRPLFVLRQFLVTLSLRLSTFGEQLNRILRQLAPSFFLLCFTLSSFFFFHSNSLAVIVVDRHTDVGTRERRAATRSSVKSRGFIGNFSFSLSLATWCSPISAWKNRTSRRFKEYRTGPALLACEQQVNVIAGTIDVTAILLTPLDKRGRSKRAGWIRLENLVTAL